MGSLTRDVIEKIQELVPVKDRIVEINGLPHTYGSFQEVRDPEHEALSFATLDGFIDYLMKAAVPEDMMVCIDSETQVSLKSCERDKWNEFTVFATASADRYTGQYGFGERYDPEKFVIALQTSFVQDENRDTLIQVASNMSGESESKVEDDGVTQSTTVGRAVKTKVQIKNPVVLRPYRTFHEITQIASPFVFRIHTGERGYEVGRLALYESDSGKWKLDAIKAIAKYIDEATKSKFYIYT